MPHTKCVLLFIVKLLQTVPVAARSKGKLCSRSVAGLAGPNPTGAWLFVFVVCCVGSDVCDKLIAPSDGFWRVCVFVCVCMYVCTYEVCSNSIRIGIIVVVHWLGCVCNRSWHVRTCLSNSWHKLQVAAFAQLAVVGRGSSTCVYVIEIFTMCESTEQRICIKFCFKTGKTATKTYQLLQQAYGEDAMGRTQVFEWFRPFNLLAPE